LYIYDKSKLVNLTEKELDDIVLKQLEDKWTRCQTNSKIEQVNVTISFNKAIKEEEDFKILVV
jgi:hypothetical protein